MDRFDQRLNEPRSLAPQLGMLTITLKCLLCLEMDPNLCMSDLVQFV